MAVWPTELPAPALNSFNETPPMNAIRSNMDRGPAKVRRRTTANVRPVSFTLLLTQEQTQILDDFFVNDTFSGAEQFDFTHPRTGAAVKARFAGEPSYSETEGIIYSAAVQLEIMP